MPRARARSDDTRKDACRRALACRLIDIGYELSEIADHARGPSLDTLCEWLSKDGDVRARFDKARALRRERLAASIVALADDATLSPRDRRLAIDARKWRVALMDKHAKTDAANPGAADEEFIRRLEEGLPRADRMERADPERTAKVASDDRSRYETTAMEPEPAEPKPMHRPPDVPEDTSANDGVSSWTIKFPEEVGGEGVTAGPPPDGWWK